MTFSAFLFPFGIPLHEKIFSRFYLRSCKPILVKLGIVPQFQQQCLLLELSEIVWVCFFFFEIQEIPLVKTKILYIQCNVEDY